MTDSRVEDVLREQSQMEADRGNWESHWLEAAERVLPRQRDFQQQKRVGGEKLSEKIFDSTAPLAAEKFAAVMESMLTPRTQRWHELRKEGFRAMQRDGQAAPNSPAVDQWLWDVTSALFAARYAATANFAGQMHETYVGLGVFGTGAVFVDDLLGRGIRYKAVALAELFIAQNFQGFIDKVHRRFEMTARQWVQKFGDETPEAIRKAAQTEPERKFELIHCVKPREDADWSRADYRGMPFASYYVSFEGRKLMREGGYRSMRYCVSRYVTAPRETYGRSPAMTVLADIKTANQQAKTLLQTGELVARPPMLLTDDGALGPFKMQPGAYNYGALGPNGEILAAPLQVGANFPITLEMQQETRRTINDAFLVELFRALIENPNMTATQAMLIAQQQGMLLGPTMGRQQSELLGPLIEAEIDILSQASALPPPPDELDAYEVEYNSPLSRAQRAEEGVAITRTLEQAAVVAQYDERAVRVLKGEDMLRDLAQINGLKPSHMRTPEEMAALDAQEAQQQQIAETLGAAEVAAKAARDFAQAQAIAGAAPGQVAPQLLPAGA